MLSVIFPEKANRITFKIVKRFDYTLKSYLLAKGIDIWVVARLLGHKDIQQIIKTYGHVLQEVIDKEYELIRQFMLDKE